MRLVSGGFDVLLQGRWTHKGGIESSNTRTMYLVLDEAGRE